MQNKFYIGCRLFSISMIDFKKVKIKDVIIVLLILGVTFGYFFVDNILDKKYGFFEFYTDAGLLYYSKMKLLIIIFGLIWYFTSKHWWKSAILVIIFIELLKLISIFDINQKQMDEIEYYKSLPITIPIILLLFFISKKINDYNLAKEIRLDLDIEIDNLFFELHQDKINNINQLNDKFDEAKKKLSNDDNLEYLKELISIRDEFYNI